MKIIFIKKYWIRNTRPVLSFLTTLFLHHFIFFNFAWNLIYPLKLSNWLIYQLQLTINLIYFSLFEKLCRKISSSSRILHSVCPLFPGYWKWLPSKMTPFHDEVGQIKWVNCNILLPRMKCMYRVPQVEVDFFGTNTVCQTGFQTCFTIWKTYKNYL